VVETNFGVVDARIDKLGEQMDRILNLSPPPPEELISAANLHKDSATDIEEEAEIAKEEQGVIPDKENDPETESPEETN
jgi:hypothetical protein